MKGQRTTRIIRDEMREDEYAELESRLNEVAVSSAFHAAMIERRREAFTKSLQLAMAEILRRERQHPMDVVLHILANRRTQSVLPYEVERRARALTNLEARRA